MSEVFLGVIAVATLVMAVIQVCVVVAGIIAVKRMQEMLVRVEDAVKPVIAHVDDLVTDATASVAAVRVQIDRVEQHAVQVLKRTEQTVQRVQDYLVAPAREGMALAAGARALFGAFRTPIIRAFRSAIG
jgi:predicted PurR-regulated permease PerM